MVTTIGDSSNYVGWIADNATPGSATYAWYFTTASVPVETEEYAIYPGTEFHNANHVGTGIQNGMRNINQVIADIHLAVGTDYDNLKKALSYWSVNNSLLHMSFKDYDGTEIAQISNSSQSLVAIRFRILRVNKRRDVGAQIYKLTINIREFTS